MKSLDWLSTHHRSVLFLLFTFAIAGLISALHVPVALFPSIDFPRVMISLNAGEQPTQQTVLQMTMPVEEAIRQIPGVRDVRSRTGRGTADVSVTFDWGMNMSAATLQINAAVAQVVPTLPPGTVFNVRRMDPSVFPILAYSLTSKTVPPTQLRDIAQYQLRPLLTSVNGVANVMVVGGKQAEYHVDINPQRLAAYGLNINTIINAVNTANSIAAVGRLEDHYQLYLVIADNSIHTLQAVQNIVVSSKGNNIVHLRDVATVSLSSVPQWIRVNSDGKDAVLLQLFQQPDGNSVSIAHDVALKLATYQSQLPKGVTLTKWYDQSQLVLASAKGVRNAILIGLLLASIIIWIFLRSLKITLIAILVVPAALAATILLLFAFNLSFNIMTLGGMAAAVGLIIDDAIVMIEHIARRMRSNVGHFKGKIMLGAAEFFQPLSGSSAATIIIFAPLAFLTGVTGAFFKALSLTMASALIFSFLITWLAVPLLATYILTQEDADKNEKGKFTSWVHEHYETALTKLFAKPQLLLVGITPLLLLGMIAYHQVGSGFMPAMDEGGFNIDYKTMPGTSLSETDRLVKQVEAIIQTIPDIQSYSRRTGVTFGGADPFSEQNEGDFIVQLKPYPRRSVDEVINNLRQQIELNVPGLSVEFAQLMEDMIGDLTAVPQPIEIEIYSDNQTQLRRSAHQVATAISNINGVVDINEGLNPTGSILQIYVDPVKAALEGMDPNAITIILNSYLVGTVATNLQQAQKMIGVRVSIPSSKWSTSNDLLNLIIPAPDGHLFPLKRVATITEVGGQAQITRDNLKSMVAVTARISGRDMGSVIKDVQKIMAKPNLLPPGGYYQLGGLYQQQQIAFKGLLFVFLTAFALVFFLQLFLYEQFLIAIAIMLIPLMSVTAIFIGLWLTGTELNIASMMGMTMILGITTEVAIFYFSEYCQLIQTEEQIPALILAGKNRIRPIAMTTIATILTLLPLALASGQGATMEQPLAIAIIFGLIVQLPLILLVMPVIFYVLRVKSRQFKRSFQP